MSNNNNSVENFILGMTNTLLGLCSQPADTTHIVNALNARAHASYHHAQSNPSMPQGPSTSIPSNHYSHHFHATQSSPTPQQSSPTPQQGMQMHANAQQSSFSTPMQMKPNDKQNRFSTSMPTTQPSQNMYQAMQLNANLQQNRFRSSLDHTQSLHIPYQAMQMNTSLQQNCFSTQIPTTQPSQSPFQAMQMNALLQQNCVGTQVNTTQSRSSPYIATQMNASHHQNCSTDPLDLGRQVKAPPSSQKNYMQNETNNSHTSTGTEKYY